MKSQCLLSFHTIAFCFAFAASLVDATCYAPNGTALTSRPDFIPCNQFSADNSVCCSLDKSIGSQFHDICLSNGLCEWDTGHGIEYYRNGCSNSSWPSAYCLTDVCGGALQVDDAGSAELTPCDGTATSATWCCGKNTTSCCGKGSSGGEVTLRATLVAATSTASKTATTSAKTATASAAETAPACPAANNTRYKDVGGSTYRIFCSSDSDEGSYTSYDLGSSKQGFSACFSICDADVQCQSFTWATNACYLKNVPGTLNNATDRVVGRRLSGPTTTTSTSDSSNPTSASGSSSSSSSGSTSSSSSDSGSASSDNGLSVGAKAGIGIGAAALALLFAGLVACLLIMRRRKRARGGEGPAAGIGDRATTTDSYAGSSAYPYYADHDPDLKSTAPTEMDARSPPSEVAGGDVYDRGAQWSEPKELEGDSVHANKEQSSPLLPQT